jgi:hypothetical protein
LPREELELKSWLEAAADANPKSVIFHFSSIVE